MCIRDRLTFATGAASCAVLGCTDPNANNYDPNADTDDGSCEYPCTDNEIAINMYDSWGDGWNGATYEIFDDMGASVATGGLTTGAAGADTLCLVDGCYDVTVGGGFYDSEITFDFGSLVGVTAGTYQVAVGAGVCTVLGCTDATSFNYDSLANTDDGSCDYCSCGLYECGCMDDQACNYNPNAIYDDGSCWYAELGFDCDGVCYDANENDVCDIDESGCTDYSACNYNPTAQIDDGSCDYNHSECIFPPQFNGNTGANMTVFLTSGVVSALPLTSVDPYVVALTDSGLVVGSASLAQNDLIGGQQALAVWGDDSSTPEVDGAAVLGASTIISIIYILQ